MPHTVKSRRSHTAQFKAHDVVAGMLNKWSISELCKRNKISVSLYYLWKKRLISAGISGLERQKRRATKSVPSRNLAALQ